MTLFHFDGLLQKEKWLSPAFVSTDACGVVTHISRKKPSGKPTRVSGWFIPGIPNSHCHVFQYAMVGLTENRSKGFDHDDFWTWREKMYAVALTIDPDQMGAVARLSYSQMLARGYTSVLEFHYLHHDSKGKPYRQLNIMSEVLASAAEDVGIELTLVPVFYNRGGIQESLRPNQRRFGFSSLDQFQLLMEQVRGLKEQFRNLRIATGVHSIRAADENSIKEIWEGSAEPFHLHISEQVAEVEQCLRRYGMRPIEWILKKMPPRDNLNFVHATHAIEEELSLMAQHRVNVVLCPTTEGNLGDGFFPLLDYWSQGGKWTLGTDSQISINAFEELRWADYIQRLIFKKRNVFCREGGQRSAEMAFQEVVSTGRLSMGAADDGYPSVGNPLSGLVLDSSHVMLKETHENHRLATAVYGADTQSLLGTMVRGKWKVRNGSHIHQERYERGFLKAVRSLRSKS